MSSMYESTPPAHMIDPMRGPMMYPTPSNSGEASMATEPAASVERGTENFLRNVLPQP